MAPEQHVQGDANVHGKHLLSFTPFETVSSSLLLFSSWKCFFKFFIDLTPIYQLLAPPPQIIGKGFQVIIPYARKTFNVGNNWVTVTVAAQGYAQSNGPESLETTLDTFGVEQIRSN